MKLYGTPHLRQAAIEQRDRDEAAIKQIGRMIRDRNRSATGPDRAGQGIARMIRAQIARVPATAPPAATLVRRPQRRPVDSRKELIAILKMRHPEALARRICELIDREISSAPTRKAALAPLESWRRHAQDTRSWVGFYDRDKTHELVRSYVNKVPPLKTSPKSSK
jgi:hypothetical protein